MAVNVIEKFVDAAKLAVVLEIQYFLTEATNVRLILTYIASLYSSFFLKITSRRIEGIFRSKQTSKRLLSSFRNFYNVYDFVSWVAFYSNQKLLESFNKGETRNILEFNSSVVQIISFLRPILDDVILFPHVVSEISFWKHLSPVGLRVEILHIL